MLFNLARLSVLYFVPGLVHAESSVPGTSVFETSSVQDSKGVNENTRFNGVSAIIKEYTDSKVRFDQRDAQQENLNSSKIPNPYILLDSYISRLLDICNDSPTDSAAELALEWILLRPVTDGQGTHAVAFGKAVDTIVINQYNSERIARACMKLKNVPSRNRDRLFEELVKKSTNKEANGIIKIAAALYWMEKARYSRAVKKASGRFQVKIQVEDTDGKNVERVIPGPFDEQYEDYLRMIDPITLEVKAVDTLKSVSQQYQNMFYQHINIKGTSTTQSQTVAEFAREHLEEFFNLAIGRPAPEIDGVAINGIKTTLQSYRGKVAVVSFWAGWCPPCMKELPNERELFARMATKPFVLLGVNCDEDLATAKAVIEREKIEWLNWYNGAPDQGKIVSDYHVTLYPATFILDQHGIIRYKNLRGSALIDAVNILLDEIQVKENPIK